MNLGVLQQYGTPDELYNKPENRFVANFIGSVLNNFLPCAYERATGGRPWSSAATARASTSPIARQRSESRSMPGGQVTASIRPELVRLVASDSPDAVLRAKISLVEPLGAKDVVHLTYDGLDIRSVGVPGNRPTVGENVGLAFDPAGVHLFDDETGPSCCADGQHPRREHRQALRAGDRAERRLASTWPTASSSPSSARPGPARPRRCARSSGSRSPTRATSTSTTTGSRTCGPATATSRSCSRTWRSTRTRASTTTWRSRSSSTRCRRRR